ncbi:MAG: NUDIX domain-containing protein [bacterium]|nr:NUDIX domain-containing protein [bacterium]
MGFKNFNNPIIIEGFWKTGKTTLANFIKRRFGFSLILEPDHQKEDSTKIKDVDKWYCQQHKKRQKIFFNSRKRKIILDHSILSSAAFLYAIKRKLPECESILERFISKFKTFSKRPLITYLYVKKSNKIILKNLTDKRVKNLLNNSEFIKRYDEFYRIILPFKYDLAPLCIKATEGERLKRTIEVIKNIKKAIENNRIAQVNIIFYKLKRGKPLFLLIKRSPKRGGFWQGVTGGVKINQTLREAALAEAKEELSLRIKIDKLLPTYHSFNFIVNKGYELNEYVFIYKLRNRETIKINPEEHTEYRFVTLGEALNLLKYQSNKIVFQKASYRIIKKKKF